MGLMMNSGNMYDMGQLLSHKGINWPHDTHVYIGGEYSPTCLIMLHTDEWYSSNTMPVDHKNFALSSDGFMLEKLEMGDIPSWYQIYLGTSGWTPQELEQDLRGDKPKWLVLSHPSFETITCEPLRIWNAAVRELSTDVFSNYF
tara:strand:- start:15 stop:446 length:432 start_codon:yes stop_codon:yes gene_type:complete